MILIGVCLYKRIEYQNSSRSPFAAILGQKAKYHRASVFHAQENTKPRGDGLMRIFTIFAGCLAVATRFKRVDAAINLLNGFN
jgi:hypothetical protein